MAKRAPPSPTASGSGSTDVVVVGIDDDLQVRSLQSGALLWSYDTGSPVYASPAVVPSGVYIASTGGRVLAFGLGAAEGVKTAIVRRVGGISRAAPPWHPWRGGG